jgi:hypothetical protein
MKHYVCWNPALSHNAIFECEADSKAKAAVKAAEEWDSPGDWYVMEGMPAVMKVERVRKFMVTQESSP